MNWKINTAVLVVASFVSLTYFNAVSRINKHNSSVALAAIPQLEAPVAVQSLVVDTPPPDEINLQYPIYDRLTDFLTTDYENSLDLEDPSNIQQNVEYDPESGQYILSETIGSEFYHNPSYMSFEDFLEYEYGQQDEEYWSQRSNAAALLQRKGIIPNVDVRSKLVDRIFRGSKVDIRPTGNIDLTFGGNYQNILNPTLTKRQRTQGGFDFDMNINMNVIGKIGEALKLSTSYNTQAAFDFENQVKLEYTGDQDWIIKKIEAGNVQFPLSTSLIQGNQSLFGLKTQLQFGRLTVTSVISQQQSQAQNITLQGGTQTQFFSIKADQYDENRNFFLAHYFRNHFNEGMKNIPIINSSVSINKIEVWVTNKTGTTIDTRNIVAFMDLGEYDPYSPNINPNQPPASELPHAYLIDPEFNSNSLYTDISVDEGVRAVGTAIQTLIDPGGVYKLIPVQDFEKTYARKLTPNEYTFNPQLGFLLLNQQLNADEVLAVAYQYTYNGRTFQVGEFAQDVPLSVDTPNVLFLKLLKSTSTRPTLPIWDLMMKNIYSLGAYQISQEDFFLDIYYLDPGGGEKRYIPADNLNGNPLIRVLGLDRLNNNNDPQPDGVFDFIPGITISPSNGKMIFPLLEPFGSDLAAKFSSAAAAQPYVYQVLYDSTKTIALQFPEFNRYSLKGTYKSSISNEISLGAFNVPQGSVQVTAGGQNLVENVDYTVDYNLGRVKILNAGILNSGVPINVSYENQELFTFQTKTLLGTRLDYFINDNFSLGGTYMHLWERPYTNKLNVGDDPISNSILGLDGNFKTESEFLTKLVDKIPLIDTKEESNFTFSGEVASMMPGHSNLIGKVGTVYIDDFEGTQTSYDLKFPYASWSLASTPTGSVIPDGDLINDWQYGFRRAKLSWYNIDPYFFGNQAPDGINGVDAQQYNYYTYQVKEIDIFPDKDTDPTTTGYITTFDLRFQPGRRGPYNFVTTGLGTDAEGNITLSNPEDNWGGIQRSIDQTDFEEANVEFIQFWILDPFLYNPNFSGELYINLGNISEDVLKDSKFFYENGLPIDGDRTKVDSSIWSYAPKLPPINTAFDNNPDARQWQDVGFDGVRNSSSEANTSDEETRFKVYLDFLQANFPPSVYNAAISDPANDDYLYFDEDIYNTAQTGILERYDKFNGPDGNAPIASGNSNQSFAATNEPDSEDLNRDNTVNETEEYFEYKVEISPTAITTVGQNFVTDIIESELEKENEEVWGTARWIQIKIPLEEYNKRVGNIQDFKSIRFARIYLTGFDNTVVIRCAKMELVRNQWRKYLFSLETPGEYIPDDNNPVTSFNVSSVSLEENSSREPVNYVLPPGIEQETLINPSATLLQNEQSLSLQACNLQDGDARAVYKTLNLDLRVYDSLKMFVHAESVVGQPPLSNGDITGFIRLGSDFVSNFYEYELPLEITPPGIYDNDEQEDRRAVWPSDNNFNISIDDLTEAKQARNIAGIPINQPFIVYTPSGAKITILGNPDLGITAVCMLGIRNPKAGTHPGDDDSQPKCVEVWFNELRLAGFDEQGGYAALARAEIQLADFGHLALSGGMHTIGFGQLEQKLNERFKDNFFQYDASASFELGKFIPKSIGIKLPMYAGVSKTISNPQYDPYDHDILLEDKLSLITDQTKKDSARKAAQAATTITSLNFTNIRKVSTGKNQKLHIYSPENINLTYAFTKQYTHNPILESDLARTHHGEFAYLFPGKSKFISPIGKVLPKSKWFKPVREFNFNLLPTNLSFRTAMDRQFGETRFRPISIGDSVIPTYNKFFTWDRLHAFKFDITKGLSTDFNAVTNTRIDEPEGLIDIQEEKDSIWSNIQKFGRTTNYNHSANAAYTLPLNKFPLTDWISSNVRYGAQYTWLSAPLVLDTLADSTVRIIPSPLGNTISNNQNINGSADLNFRNLYNKWKWLKKYDTNAPKSQTSGKEQNKKGEEEGKETGEEGEEKKDDKKKDDGVIGPEAILIRLPLMLKRINFNYTETHNTVLPGYLKQPKWAGQDFSVQAPGWDFIFGYQPDSNWLNKAASKGWITNDTALNYLFVQNSSQNISMKATLEPFKDVNIELNFTRNKTNNLTEYFKQTSTGDFTHLSRLEFGSFSMSYISLQTAFNPIKSGEFSQTFRDFEDYRAEISARLDVLNPYSNGIFSDSLSQYRDGYGPYSQDVLIPAFLAAYTNQSAGGVDLKLPFDRLPLPNWRITYNGLTKLAWAKKIWSNVSISHSYTSTLTFGSYASSLDFVGNEVAGYKIPQEEDPISGNLISFYDIPIVAINESFSPLLGIDFTWKNSLTTKFEYSKSRNLSFSMFDYQLTEARTTEITTGVGYKFKNVRIPFKWGGKKIKLKNDVNFLCDVSFSDNVTLSQRLDQEIAALPTSGIKTIAISPAADYTVNSRLNVRLFLNKRFTIPYVSTSYPINYTDGGVTIRFTLAQ